ncbi:hypothetical protein [Actinomadura sp. WAC 06369]|uniref:hypothetical protein n=1 Tax=Actinomadura sp. WAC 06369 TaxID=2203193 RepID=UPI003FA3D338
MGRVRRRLRRVRWPQEAQLHTSEEAEESGPVSDGLYLRMDERRYRLAVLPGDADRVLDVGWEVRDQFALAAVRDAVEKAGVEVSVLSHTEAGGCRR